MARSGGPEGQPLCPDNWRLQCGLVVEHPPGRAAGPSRSALWVELRSRMDGVIHDDGRPVSADRPPDGRYLITGPTPLGPARHVPHVQRGPGTARSRGCFYGSGDVTSKAARPTRLA